MKNLPKNLGRKHHAMVSLGTKIILFGGQNDGYELIGGEIYELDCHTCDWRMLDKTLENKERTYMVAFSVPRNWSLC